MQLKVRAEPPNGGCESGYLTQAFYYGLKYALQPESSIPFLNKEKKCTYRDTAVRPNGFLYNHVWIA